MVPGRDPDWGLGPTHMAGEFRVASPLGREAQLAVTSDGLVCCAWPGPSGVMWKRRKEAVTMETRCVPKRHLGIHPLWMESIVSTGGCSFSSQTNLLRGRSPPPPEAWVPEPHAAPRDTYS